jgi:probable HAF family extracellular repeat protein
MKSEAGVFMCVFAAIPMWASAQGVSAHRLLEYSLTDLGTIVGGTYGAVGSLNNAAIVAGSVEVITPESTVQYHAFIYSQGTMQDIGRLTDQEIDVDEDDLRRDLRKD